MFDTNPAPAANPAEPSAPANPSNPASFAGQSTPGIPEGGQAKFYNAQTGAYNWEAHSREQAWVNQQRSTGQPNGQPAPGTQQTSTGNPNADAVLQELAADVARGGNGIQARIKLAQMGIPETMVEAFAGNVVNQQQTAVRGIQEYAGQALMGDPAKGTEAINAMKTWVNQNLPADKRAELNRMVQSGGTKIAIDYVKSLMGGVPNAPRVDMGGMPGGAAQGFASKAEMTTAINDPKYRSDPAYRAQVRARVLATPHSGKRFG